MRGIVTLIVIVAVVLGAIVLGRSGTEPTATNTSHPVGNHAPVPPVNGGQVLEPVSVTLECENYSQIADTANGVKLMKKDQRSEGRPIKFLKVAGDAEFQACGLKDKFHDPALVASLPEGKVVYEFELPREDTYYVNLRAQWFDSCGNSVWFRLDAGKFFKLEDTKGQAPNDEKTYAWAWHQMIDTGAPVGFKLSAGKHTLTMALREHGMLLDKWVLTTNASEMSDK